MATTTLRPSGDGSTGSWTRSPASGTFASKVAEAVASNDGDTSYILSPNTSSGSIFLELDDVPADFDPDAISAITIRVAHRRLNTPNMAVDLGTVHARLVRSDESTAISETPSAAASPIQAGYQQTTFTPSATGTHTVDDWNGARLELTFTHTNQQTGDSVNQIRISAAEVEVAYTPVADPPGEGSGSAGFSLGASGEGRAVHAGLAAVALALAVVGTGVATHAGAGSPAITLTVSGVGEAPSEPPPEGFGAPAIALASGGAGEHVASGAGASGVALGSSATGLAVHSGSGASSVALASSGVGETIQVGAGAASLGFGLTGVGEHQSEGGNATDLTLGASGVGVVLHAGSGSADVALSLVGTGEAPDGISSGSGVAALSLGTEASGESIRFGDGALALSLASSGAGATEHRGDGSSPLTLTVTGHGEAPTQTAEGFGVAALALSVMGEGPTSEIPAAVFDLDAFPERVIVNVEVNATIRSVDIAATGGE